AEYSTLSASAKWEHLKNRKIVQQILSIDVLLLAFSFRLTINALAQKLNAYWKEKTSQENFETSAITTRPIPEHCWTCTKQFEGRSREPSIPGKRKIPDQTWVQCDECLKWRKLPGKVDPSTLPARWFCYYNSHPKYRRCSVPEEQELIDEDLYLSKAKKQDQAVEKKLPPVDNENHQVFANPLKIPAIQDTDELNSKTIGYEGMDSPSRPPSVGEESRTPSLQLKPLDSSVFQFSRWVENIVCLQ
ncbi:MORC family CW-type zinc finger protein 4-like, partial [Leptonychotes weddellii]|uniref:MORC family CW-type zinc finger protein 4-like n=1 Tax=Leptonychotes weddellii TaxID=9713 RepID=A0A7F8RR93_LEPWE